MVHIRNTWLVTILFCCAAYGQTLINKPPLTITDSSTTSPLKITERSSQPSSPATNHIYLDDGTNASSTKPCFRRYTGTAWENIGQPYDADIDIWAAITPHASWQDILDGTTTTLSNLRTIRDQLGRPYINVKTDYNAVGDGGTDDTTAVQAAVTAASAAGGIVHFPPGDYALSTASLDALAHNALAITGDGVTIQGAGVGSTTIRLTGTTTGCSVLYASDVNDLVIRGIRFVGIGDAVAVNYALSYGTASATGDVNGLTIEDCEFDNFRYDGWVDIEVASGSYDINDVTLRHLKFYSRDGDMFSDGGAGAAADCIRIDSAGPPGYVEHVRIEDCWFDCTYIKRAVTLKDGVRHAVVRDCYAYGCGLDKATDAVQSYAMMTYGIGCDDIEFRNCQIVSPWTCGIYGVYSTNVRIIDCTISGQQDTTDSSLCVGGIAFGAASDLQIRGGTVSDCAIGIQVQPVDLESNIIIDGVAVLECGAKGIHVREGTVLKHLGGVQISDCSLKGSDIQIYRSTGGTFLNLIDIQGCTLERGKIYFMQNTFWSRVTDCTIMATDQTNGLWIGGGSIVQVTGNRICGPGAAAASTHGLYLSSGSANAGTIISGNVIVGFYDGIYAPYTSASFRDNVVYNVTERVNNAGVGDLGREAPSGITGGYTTYWPAGQMIDNLYIATTPQTDGWKCIAPASGIGCTYTTTTTGDMTDTEYVITGIAAGARYIPGVALTLANAAAGPATLSTEVVSWQIAYTDLSGTFTDGEWVESGTNKGLGTIESDDGSATMYLVNIPYGASGFAAGETLYGHNSGATATVASVALLVADVCGNTVDDAVLSLVAPTWATIGTMAVGQTTHDYGAAAADWTLTAAEAVGSEFSVSNASGAVNMIFSAAQVGKPPFAVINGSGQVLTVQVTGQAGITIANAKTSICRFSSTDVVEIYETP